jgi:hypothetical protein
MTPHTFDTTTLTNSSRAGYTTVVEAHLSIAIGLGSGADVTVSSALAAPAHANQDLAKIAPGTGAHDTARIDDLVSDDDEFTSMPSTSAAVPVAGDPVLPAAQANGTGNGYATPVG